MREKDGSVMVVWWREGRNPNPEAGMVVGGKRELRVEKLPYIWYTMDSWIRSGIDCSYIFIWQEVCSIDLPDRDLHS